MTSKNHFYRATARNATHGNSMAILFVRPPSVRSFTKSKRVHCNETK